MKKKNQSGFILIPMHFGKNSNSYCYCVDLVFSNYKTCWCTSFKSLLNSIKSIDFLGDAQGMVYNMSSVLVFYLVMLKWYDVMRNCHDLDATVLSDNKTRDCVFKSPQIGWHSSQQDTDQ